MAGYQRDGVTFAKVSFLAMTWTMSITYATVLYDYCKTAIKGGGSLPVFFACYAGINIMLLSINLFCEVFGRHSTLNAIDVPVAGFATLWIYAGAYVHLLKKHEGAPNIIKIFSSLLTLLAFATFYFTYYDRRVRRGAPTQTFSGDENIAGKHEGESEVSV